MLVQKVSSDPNSSPAVKPPAASGIQCCFARKLDWFNQSSLSRDRTKLEGDVLANAHRPLCGGVIGPPRFVALGSLLVIRVTSS
jgi:hypothetical protein